MRRPRIMSKMKRIEIVVEADRVDTLVAIVEAHATGYTLFPNLTGYGEHGYRERNLVLLVTIVTADHLEAIVDAIMPRLNERANIVLISDVAVLRAEHFVPEVRAANAEGRV